MAEALGEELPMPDFASELMTREKISKKIGKEYEEFVESIFKF